MKWICICSFLRDEKRDVQLGRLRRTYNDCAIYHPSVLNPKAGSESFDTSTSNLSDNCEDDTHSQDRQRHYDIEYQPARAFCFQVLLRTFRLGVLHHPLALSC